MHRIVLGQRPHYHGVTRLVIRSQLPLLLGDHAAVLLGTGDHLDDRLVDGRLVNSHLVLTACQQRRLIQQIFQIRAGKAGGTLGHLTEIHILRQRLIVGVNGQDLLAALDVGQAHVDLAVKPSGAQQRGVQDIHPVGGGQHHNALVGAEAVHLHQQLIQRLLTLVMAAAQSAAALTAHGVDLVDKHDGRRFLFGLQKQVADTAGAYTHIHLHKVGAGDGQELYVCLTGHRLGQQRLTGTRRANQQHTLGDMGAQLQILFGVPQKFHDLLQFLFFLVSAGHIPEGDLFIALRNTVDPGLTKVGHLVADAACAAVHAGHQVHQHDEGHGCQHIGKQHLQPVGGGSVGVVVGGDDPLGVLLHHQVVEIIVKEVEVTQLAGSSGLILQRGGQPGAVDGEGLHFLLYEQLPHLAIRDIALTGHAAGQIQHQQQADHKEKN